LRKSEWRLWELFHRVWGKAIDQPDYNKAEWRELAELIGGTRKGFRIEEKTSDFKRIYTDKPNEGVVSGSCSMALPRPVPSTGMADRVGGDNIRLIDDRGGLQRNTGKRRRAIIPFRRRKKNRE
jgi:hypothetical protein